MATKPYRFTLPLEDGSVKLQLSAQMTADRYRLAKERHCNAEYELHIFLSGTCYADIQGLPHTIKSPQALLIAPQQYHDFHSESKDTDRLAISFTLSEGELFDAMKQNISSFAIFSLPAELVKLCYRIFSEYDSQSPYQHTMIPLLTCQLICEIFRLLELSKSAPIEIETINPCSRTDMIDAYFSRSFPDDWDEATLAKKLHLSKRQLARVLQEHYGMTFRQKRIISRMEHAKYLLRVTDMSIGEIAQAEGYRSEAAFYKAFRSHYNTTPHAYRASKKA